MFYGDSETGQTLPQDFIFLKEQWTLNNISMFVQLPNDISSAAQQFFFPTKHGLNRALLSLSVSRAFLPELLWGYYIQAQELILQLLKLHPLIPVCCSRSLTGPNNHGKISLYWQPPSALMSTNRVSGCYHKRCHWPYNHRSMDRVSVGCSLLVWLFQACPASFPAIWSNSPDDSWQLCSFYNLSVQDVWIRKIWILQMTSHFLLSSLCMSFQKAADEGMTAWCQGHKKR